MTGKIIYLHNTHRERDLNVASRLRDIAAMLRTIDAGELLVALPDCALARLDHSTALTLLRLVEGEVLALCEVVETAAYP